MTRAIILSDESFDLLQTMMQAAMEQIEELLPSMDDERDVVLTMLAKMRNLKFEVDREAQSRFLTGAPPASREPDSEIIRKALMMRDAGYDVAQTFDWEALGRLLKDYDNKCVYAKRATVEAV